MSIASANPNLSPSAPAPAIPGLVANANASAVSRVLSRAGDEDRRHDESMRRVEHDRLKQALSVATHFKAAANMQLSQAVSNLPKPCYESLSPAHTATARKRVAECQAYVAQAEADEVKAAEALAGFEAAEELRRHGRIGDIVMMLTVTCDEQAREIAALKARLSKLEGASAPAGL